MAAKKITVVISQAQGKHPVRRQLEEELAAALMMQADVDVSLVPHLVDMESDHTGLLFLRSIPGDLVILAWLYPRGARWVLDRQGVKGLEGQTLLTSEEDEDEEDDLADQDEPQGIGTDDVPSRRLYCIDLRASTDPQEFLEEIRRIATEESVQTVDLMQWIQGNPRKEQIQRYLHPAALLDAARGNGNGSVGSNGAGTNGNGQSKATPAGPEPVQRRWYPVIDYSRCTNCMECIDFCLFGVYGVDGQDKILVEQQDSCKKGCPACSRVCPENAIIFPGHKTPAIAGAPGDVAGLKIDLSQLFGAPSALDQAVLERDTELVADGRDAVGISIGIPKRQPAGAQRQRDELDDLMDGLDDPDL